MIRKLAEMLVLKPSLAALAPPHSHYEGAGSHLPPVETEFLFRLVDLCLSQPDLRNIAEHFRGDQFEGLAREVEVGSLRWEHLESAELEVEFSGAWQGLNEQARTARASLYSEKNLPPSQMTAEEKEMVRNLHRREGPG